MKNKPLLSILLLTILFACGKSDPPATPVELQATTLVENLIVPWEILWGPDNKIWMTERTGKISRVDTGTGAIIPLLTVSEVVHQGEAGMLGMVLHPNFNTTPQVFVAYNYNNGGNLREKIVRYTYNGTTLINPLIIQDNIAASNIHNGCRLAIGPDMKLYISTGDASVPSNSQNSSSLNGKILRLNLDGTIPADNPSAGSPIWTKGHRNPQGLVFVNDRLYSAEHGPDTDDEVNIIEKGRNYGWPDVPGFCDGSETAFCNANNVKEPIKAWTPTLAVSGIDYYNHDLIPQWKNSILVATLKNQRIYQLKLNGDGSAVTEINEYLTNTYGRLRDFCISPDGKVFVSTSNGGNDKIIKINKK